MPCTKTLVDMNYPQELYLLLNLHVREGSTYNLADMRTLANSLKSNLESAIVYLTVQVKYTYMFLCISLSKCSTLIMKRVNWDYIFYFIQSCYTHLCTRRVWHKTSLVSIDIKWSFNFRELHWDIKGIFPG